MKRVIVLVLIIVLTVSLSLMSIGCKDSSEADDKGTEEVINEEAADEEVTEEASETVETDKPYAGKEIIVVAQSSVGRDEAYKSWVGEFYELTGIKANIIDFAVEQMLNKYTTDFLSDTGAYDVMEVKSPWDGNFIQYLEVLDPYIERDGYDMEDYIPLFQTGVGISSMSNMQRYGMPLVGQSMALFYRTDILGDAGLNPDDWETWEDFMAACEVLDSDDISALSTAGVNPQLFKLIWAIYLIQDGGQQILSADWEPLFNNEIGLRSMNLLKQLFEYAPEGALGMENPDATAVFLAGQSAMLIEWPNVVLGSIEDPDKSAVVENWAVTAPPGPGNIGSWHNAIAKSSDNKDAAWEWLKFISSKDKVKELMIDYGNFAPRTSVWEDPDVIEQVPGAEGLKKALSESYVSFHASNPNGEAMFQNTITILADVVGGVMDSQDALDELEKIWNELNAENPVDYQWEGYVEQKS